MSWTIDEEGRCAIHVGGVCVTFDEHGLADEVLAPKSIPLRVLLELVRDAARAASSLGAAVPPSDRVFVSASLRTVPLREAAGAVCESLRGRILRKVLGRERVAMLEQLERLVALSRAHGVEFK